MKLHEMLRTPGSKKSITRVGRGTSSGKGKTSTRGQKGQNSRSGGGVRPGFEGGQTPLYRRIPKFGFHNINQKKNKIFNLDQINQLGLDEISHQTLIKANLINNDKILVKILGNGKLTKKINVKVDKISKSAKEAIIKMGGTIQEV